MIKINCFLFPSQNQARKLTSSRSCATCMTTTTQSHDSFSLKKKSKFRYFFKYSSSNCISL